MEYEKNVGIKLWAVEDRPREKLVAKGSAALTEAELIAILLRSGTSRSTAVQVALNLLSKVNNDLRELGKLTVKELTENKGIGPAKAVTIIAALELGRRRQLSDIKEKKKITSSHDVYDWMSPRVADLKHEEFWVLYLDRANKIINTFQLSKGGISATVADPRLIFQQALGLGACSIILSHNHPSGQLKPSDPDKQLTHKIKDAGNLMDIKLLDHIIVTESGYFSFADEGLIG